MSVKCPACGCDSADGAAFCDLCKEPFLRKARPKPAPVPQAPNPLAGMTKEQLLESSEKLLKSDSPQVQAPPPWLRPLSYLFLMAMLAFGAMALSMLHGKYKEKQPEPPPPSGTLGP